MGGGGEEIVNMNSHHTPRLDILGSEGGMEEGGATEEGDEATCIGRGASRAENEPVSGELLGAQKHVLYSAMNFLEVKGVNTGEEFGEESEFTRVEVGNKRVKGTGIPGT